MTKKLEPGQGVGRGKGGGSKPKFLTEEEIIQVEALAAVLNTDQIADYFGIGRKTFYSIMARNPDVGIRYKKGRAKAALKIGGSLIQAALNGDGVRQIFYMKTQAGWKETQVIENDQSTPTAIKITFNVVDGRGEKNI